MRTTRRPRPSRRHAADSFGAAPWLSPPARSCRPAWDCFSWRRTTLRSFAPPPASRRAGRRWPPTRPSPRAGCAGAPRRGTRRRARPFGRRRAAALSEQLALRPRGGAGAPHAADGGGERALETAPDALAAGASERAVAAGLPAGARPGRLRPHRPAARGRHAGAGAVVHNGPAPPRRLDAGRRPGRWRSAWPATGAAVVWPACARMPAGFRALGLPAAAGPRPHAGRDDAGDHRRRPRAGRRRRAAGARTWPAPPPSRWTTPASSSQAQAEARCREQALAAVSHEMRGPLQVISIASGALLRALAGRRLARFPSAARSP